jgi:hypothetical protein
MMIIKKAFLSKKEEVKTPKSLMSNKGVGSASSHHHRILQSKKEFRDDDAVNLNSRFLERSR